MGRRSERYLEKNHGEFRLAGSCARVPKFTQAGAPCLCLKEARHVAGFLEYSQRCSTARRSEISCSYLRKIAEVLTAGSRARVSISKQTDAGGSGVNRSHVRIPRKIATWRVPRSFHHGETKAYRGKSRVVAPACSKFSAIYTRLRSERLPVHMLAAALLPQRYCAQQQRTGPLGLPSASCAKQPGLEGASSSVAAGG
jgi:hypothetical protein